MSFSGGIEIQGAYQIGYFDWYKMDETDSSSQYSLQHTWVFLGNCLVVRPLNFPLSFINALFRVYHYFVGKTVKLIGPMTQAELKQVQKDGNRDFSKHIKKSVICKNYDLQTFEDTILEAGFSESDEVYSMESDVEGVIVRKIHIFSGWHKDNLESAVDHLFNLIVKNMK